MLHLNDITVRIEGRTILDSATAGIPTGHKVGLVGRNGAGKTTLLRIIAGDMSPDDGSITVRSGGGFGKKKTDVEEKTFKISSGIKITRTVGKDKDEVKLTLDELKTAVKVTNVFVTITHEGENGTEIKVGGGRGFGKKKKKDAVNKSRSSFLSVAKPAHQSSLRS